MRTRTLSATEARVVLSLESEGSVDVTLDQIRRRAEVSAGFARKLAHNLVAKAWLQRVGPGRYLLNPSRHGPEALADTDPLRFGSRLVDPYYFGYATAAELRGLLPQASRVYYLVTPRAGRPTWNAGAEFRRVRIAPRRFFGFSRIERRGTSVAVSDVERTVVDCLSRPDLSGGLGGTVQILRSAGRQVDWRRLRSYLRRFGSRSLELRLGSLVELLGAEVRVPDGWLDRLQARPAEPFVPLGPPREFGRRGPHDRRWHVIRNVSDRLLRAEVDIR